MPNARRATATMSCDVGPVGLSTSSMPSVVLVLVGDRLAFLDLGEKRFDARRARDALVEEKRELRRGPEAQRATDARTEMGREARQSLERGFAFLVRAHDADEHLGGAQIARYLDRGDRHEADDARIFDALVEKRCDFNPDRLGDSVGAASIVGHRVLAASAPSCARRTRF